MVTRDESKAAVKHFQKRNVLLLHERWTYRLDNAFLSIYKRVPLESVLVLVYGRRILLIMAQLRLGDAFFSGNIYFFLFFPNSSIFFSLELDFKLCTEISIEKSDEL